MTWTFYMREGMKWSDGDDYTADDLLFWFENVQGDNEASMQYREAGAMNRNAVADATERLEKVDDYTLRFHLKAPDPRFEWLVGQRSERELLNVDAHYLPQFHPAGGDAEALAARVAAGGFDTWMQLFEDRRDRMGNTNPDKPHLMPWGPSNPPPANPAVFSANPYNFAVDDRGHQLPYLETQRYFLVSDGEAQKLRLLSGGDSWGIIKTLESLPLAKRAQEDGKIMFQLTPKGDAYKSTVTLFNMNAREEWKAELFRDVRFRQAYSLFIPRQKISDIMYGGAALPTLGGFMYETDHPWYLPELGQSPLIEQDLDRANALLDELLPNKDADGFRLGPDGQPITLTIFSIATWFDDTWSLLVEELPKIGFKGNFRGVGWGAQGEVVNNMDWEIIGWQSLTDYANRDWPSRFGGPWASLTPSNSWSRPWYLWLTTGGAQGEQPPAFAQEMWDVAQAAKSAESDEVLTEKIIRLQQLQAEYLIGTDLVQFAHRFRAYASDVGNVQEWFIQMPTIYFHRDQAERDKTLGG
jgi:peptide/nickel transport system substrate-binding protein